MSKILYENATIKWIRNHIGHETTVCRCEKCRLFYKPSLGINAKKERWIHTMNNRYLYRAKRTDNGEWVIGNLIDSPDGRNAISETSGDWGLHEVDPSTICQCTGLKDKNGELIYDYDIVELYDRITDYRWRAIVLFGNMNCDYTWGWKLKPIGECETNTDILCWIEMEESGAFCEVIGSYIDNPELLEVGE